MKKQILSLFTLVLSQTIMAQDVIVKKDGSTIMSKVLEVNTGDVKYKKFSNQQGPTYTISLADILSINYENGEKDTFSSITEELTPAKESLTSNATPPSAEDKEANNIAMDKHNNTDIKYVNKVAPKPANRLFMQFKFKEGSVIADHYAELEFKVIPGSGKFAYIDTGTSIVLVIRNKSSQTIFVDLGNTFFVREQQATPYYIPQATSTIQGTSNGVGVNVGAVAGALGVGGSLGTLASGVNVSSGQSNTSTVTVYSQRVIAVPPMSVKELEPMYVGDEGINYSNNIYYKRIEKKQPQSGYLGWGLPKERRVTRGEERIFSQEDSPLSYGIFATYSLDENFSTPFTLNANMYVAKAIGLLHDLKPSTDLSNGWDKSLGFIIWGH